MLSGLESGFGLDVVIWLQANGNPLFDLLARLLHEAGSTLFYIILLTLIYWSVDRDLGLRLAAALIVAVVTTEALKALLMTPRPHLAYPDRVMALVEQGGYGIPSGHVLQATVLWGVVALWARRRAVTVAVGLYVLLLAWSRMYAGVHYPQDVVAGLLFGGVTLWLFHRFYADGQARWAALDWPVQAVIVALSSGLAFLVTAGSEDGQAITGVTLGAGLGLVWAGRRLGFSAGGSTGQRAWRFLGGLLLTLLVYFGLSALFEPMEPDSLWRVVRYACVGLMAVAVWPWAAIRLGLVT